MTSTLQVLIKARALITDPAHWSQGAMARNLAGNDVSIKSSQAHSFCALGALQRAGYELGLSCAESNNAHELLINLIREQHETLGLIGLNDVANHATVLAVFDEAINRENHLS